MKRFKSDYLEKGTDNTSESNVARRTSLPIITQEDLSRSTHFYRSCNERVGSDPFEATVAFFVTVAATAKTCFEV